MKVALITCSLLALSAGAASAADSPWNGTWKLDEAKSHFTGQTMTFEKGAGDTLHFSDGSSVEFDVIVDGKEHKAYANRTMIWTAPAKNTWDTVYKIDGKELTKGHRTLSDDGKTLTESWTGTRPDGTSFHEEDVFTRVSGSDGLAGTWRASKVKGGGGPQEFVISVPAAGMVHYDVPDMKVNVEGRTDGSDLPLTGPTVPPGSTISFKALTPTKTRYVMKIGGKIDNSGEQTLAADGRSFTDVNWNAGKEDEKTTAVYVKQ
jgi:hypothetical protein